MEDKKVANNKKPAQNHQVSNTDNDKVGKLRELQKHGINSLQEGKRDTLYKYVKELMQEVNDTDAQDIIIIENEPIEIKINGMLAPANNLKPWDRDVFNYFVGSIVKESALGRPQVPSDKFLDQHACMSLLEEHGMSHDFTVSLGKAKSLRTHLYSVYQASAPDKKGLAIAIRVVNKDIPSWDTLNLPKFFRSVSNKKSGLVLIAGHVGSGKSTTLASLVKDINKSGAHRRSVVTIESPIEYMHQSAGAKIVQKEIPLNTPSFSKATEDAMRENADVIVIGELRTQEDMDNAIRLVEIGKLVLATIHSNSVVDTPDRIVNMFSGDAQANVRDRLSSNVICIIHQNLETIDSKQYPVVEGFFARNDQERSTLQKQFKDRASLQTLMTSNHPFVVTKKMAFDELADKVEFADMDEACERLGK